RRRRPRAAGGPGRRRRPGGRRQPRRAARLPEGPGRGRAAGGRRAPPPRARAVSLMAEVSRPALAEPASRTAPLPGPLPEQASSMLERFGILGKLLIYFLFQHV